MKKLIACLLFLLLAVPAWGGVKDDVPLGDLTTNNIISKLQKQIDVDKIWEKIQISDEVIDERVVRTYDLSPHVTFLYASDKDTQQVVMISFGVSFDTLLPKKQAAALYVENIWQVLQISVGLFTQNGRDKIATQQKEILDLMGPGNKKIYSNWNKMNLRKQDITLSAQILANGEYVLMIGPYKK